MKNMVQSEDFNSFISDIYKCLRSQSRVNDRKKNIPCGSCVELPKTASNACAISKHRFPKINNAFSREIYVFH